MRIRAIKWGIRGQVRFPYAVSMSIARAMRDKLLALEAEEHARLAARAVFGERANAPR